MSEARLLVNDTPILATIQPLLRLLQELLRQEARRHGLATLELEVGEFTDPEEGDHRVVVRQWVQAPAQQALAYWDDLETPIQAWIESLPEAIRPLADQITVSIRWTAHA